MSRWVDARWRSFYGVFAVAIAESARKHGVEDEDMRHAIDNSIVVFVAEPPATLMYVGPARSGKLIEVAVMCDDPEDLIIHAMEARAKWLNR